MFEFVVYLASIVVSIRDWFSPAPPEDLDRPWVRLDRRPLVDEPRNAPCCRRGCTSCIPR